MKPVSFGIHMYRHLNYCGLNKEKKMNRVKDMFNYIENRLSLKEKDSLAHMLSAHVQDEMEQWKEYEHQEQERQYEDYLHYGGAN